MSHKSSRTELVVILGCGINGAAIARELLLNDVGVIIVDEADIASGATSGSSRLIHGGLRYLEFGELDLVRESLAERTRLLQVAPRLVKPLKLFIPVSNRFGGVLRAAKKFLRWPERSTNKSQASQRGLWLVRTGLLMYDLLAGHSNLPRHRMVDPGSNSCPPFRQSEYPFVCSYYDAQVPFPERFVISLLHDARDIARQAELHFEVITHHRVARQGKTLLIAPGEEIGPVGGLDNARREIQADLVINATGAWVDETLRRIGTRSERLIGPTKGSHLVVRHDALRRSLQAGGCYVEAPDGRPVFILPLGEFVLVGTTDLKVEGNPGKAATEPAEVTYLVQTVNEILPGFNITASDVLFHYCGVRPLRYSGPMQPAGISRRHGLVWHTDAELPILSVVGGKLTTCRSLAEQTAGQVLQRLGMQARFNSRERPFGPASPPQDESDPSISKPVDTDASSHGIALCEMVRQQITDLARQSTGQSSALQPGTEIRTTEELVRWVIRNEWVHSLPDLLERRLMWLYDPELTRADLQLAARILADEGRLPVNQIDQEVDKLIADWQSRFQRRGIS